jgi:hypothetical protein
MWIIMKSGILSLGFDLQKFGPIIGCFLGFSEKDSNQKWLASLVLKGRLNYLNNTNLIVYAKATHHAFRPKPFMEAT